MRRTKLLPLSRTPEINGTNEKLGFVRANASDYFINMYIIEAN